MVVGLRVALRGDVDANWHDVQRDEPDDGSCNNQDNSYNYCCC